MADFKKEPIVRLADPHSSMNNEWTPADAEDRYRSNHVILEQRSKPPATPGTDFEIDRVDVGIYHDTFGISVSNKRYYTSGRMRDILGGISIPLEDRETLEALRDLIQKALDREVK